ncbi:helix-turn-helix domain-containing protein [Mycobacteroides abscessus]|uniref:helix-turn-helix domain-containing protein n=1 Tax=Mycobacteroides abscessus TaxID=36809 RepID=UPI000940F8CA|nr:helix-turn-helix transcriptional regulator [Mycobacteroides abscessus]
MSTKDGFTEEQRSRIGGAVEQARIERGWGKEAAARHAGISSITWKRVEDGLSVRDTSLRAIEKTLGWPPGHMAQLGGEPGEGTLLNRDGSQQFIKALERRNKGTQTQQDEDYIQRFMAEERAGITPDSPELADVVREAFDSWNETITLGMRLIEEPHLSEHEKLKILLDVNHMTRLLNDHLVVSSYASTDLRARDWLPDLFQWREDGERLRKKIEAQVLAESDKTRETSEPGLANGPRPAFTREQVIGILDHAGDPKEVLGDRDDDLQ